MGYLKGLIQLSVGVLAGGAWSVAAWAGQGSFSGLTVNMDGSFTFEKPRFVIHSRQGYSAREAVPNLSSTRQLLGIILESPFAPIRPGSGISQASLGSLHSDHSLNTSTEDGDLALDSLDEGYGDDDDAGDFPIASRSSFTSGVCKLFGLDRVLDNASLTLPNLDQMRAVRLRLDGDFEDSCTHCRVYEQVSCYRRGRLREVRAVSRLDRLEPKLYRLSEPRQWVGNLKLRFPLSPSPLDASLDKLCQYFGFHASVGGTGVFKVAEPDMRLVPPLQGKVQIPVYIDRIDCKVNDGLLPSETTQTVGGVILYARGNPRVEDFSKIGIELLKTR